MYAKNIKKQIEVRPEYTKTHPPQHTANITPSPCSPPSISVCRPLN